MVATANDRTGIIVTDAGWTIKLGRNTLLVNDGVREIELVVEVMQGGVNLVIYDELARKGFDKSDSENILHEVKSALNDVGFCAEVE